MSPEPASKPGRACLSTTEAWTCVWTVRACACVSEGAGLPQTLFCLQFVCHINFLWVNICLGLSSFLIFNFQHFYLYKLWEEHRDDLKKKKKIHSQGLCLLTEEFNPIIMNVITHSLGLCLLRFLLIFSYFLTASFSFLSCVLDWQDFPLH